MSSKKNANFVYETAERAFANLKYRYWISRFWFVILNITSIVLVATLIILNLYAIRFNSNPEYEFTKKWFVVISCINAFSGMVSSVIAFVSVKPKMKVIEIALVRINETFDDYKNKNSPFDNHQKRDQYFLKRVLEIVDTTLKT